MAKSEKMIKTEIKYELTSCYYCSEFLDNDNFKNHIATCGQVLQQCPDGCFAYLQRKHVEQHLLECPRKVGYSDGRSSPNESMCNWEQDVNSLRTALHEETRQRLRLIADIGELRKNSQKFDHCIREIDVAHRNLTKSLEDESNRRDVDFETIRQNVDQLKYQYKEVKEWRKELRNLLDQFHRDLEFRNDVTANFDVMFSNHYATQRRLKSIESIMKETNTKYKEEAITKEQGLNTRTDQCERCIVLERKVSEVLVEIRQMKNIVCETEDKYDKIENVSSDVRKISAETKQELTDLVEHLKMDKKLKTFVNCEGHLIWRIDGYTARLKNAKENDIIISSPIFCDRLYGYSLRMNVLLNGFGTWKGRNILACITVIPGEWDSLLSWPCRLNADIILRDQTKTNAKNITKMVTVKKRDATYNHQQYIYIPHKTMKTQSFLKNDSIFFEVIVHTPNMIHPT